MQILNKQHEQNNAYIIISKTQKQHTKKTNKNKTNQNKQTSKQTNRQANKQTQINK